MELIGSLITGFVGGIVGARFLEAYYQRRASDKVGAYDPPDDHPHRVW